MWVIFLSALCYFFLLLIFFSLSCCLLFFYTFVWCSIWFAVVVVASLWVIHDWLLAWRAWFIFFFFHFICNYSRLAVIVCIVCALSHSSLALFFLVCHMWGFQVSEILCNFISSYQYISMCFLFDDCIGCQICSRTKPKTDCSQQKKLSFFIHSFTLFFALSSVSCIALFQSSSCVCVIFLLSPDVKLSMSTVILIDCRFLALIDTSIALALTLNWIALSMCCCHCDRTISRCRRRRRCRHVYIQLSAVIQ